MYPIGDAGRASPEALYQQRASDGLQEAQEAPTSRHGVPHALVSTWREVGDRHQGEREFAWWLTAFRIAMQQLPEELEANFPDRGRREYVELLTDAIDRKLEGICRRGLIRMGLEEDRGFERQKPMRSDGTTDAVVETAPV